MIHATTCRFCHMPMRRGAHRRPASDQKRLRYRVTKWRDMPDDEMRLRAGEMTAQEIRSVRAVLNAILS